MTPTSVSEAVRAEAREAVAKMPPLTPEQRDTLTDLLAPYGAKSRRTVSHARS